MPAIRNDASERATAEVDRALAALNRDLASVAYADPDTIRAQAEASPEGSSVLSC